MPLVLQAALEQLPLPVAPAALALAPLVASEGRQEPPREDLVA